MSDSDRPTRTVRPVRLAVAVTALVILGAAPASAQEASHVIASVAASEGDAVGWAASTAALAASALISGRRHFGIC